MMEVTLQEGKSSLEFTGERFVPGISGEIEIEHVHRYLLAAHMSADKDVLDIACGEGYGSHVLAQAARSVCGVDIDEKLAAKFPYQRAYLPTVRLMDGSVHDW